MKAKKISISQNIHIIKTIIDQIVDMGLNINVYGEPRIGKEPIAECLY